MKSLVTLLVIVWLLIGVFAAFQRNYFSETRETKCATVSTTAVTIISGPLNYVGANPKINCKKLPEPSK